MGIAQKPYQPDVSPGFSVSGWVSGHTKSSPFFSNTGATAGSVARLSVCHVASHTNGAACIEASEARIRSSAKSSSRPVSLVSRIRMNAPCGVNLT